MSNYVTNQEVREQAGFQYKVKGESLGTGNGTAKAFSVENIPIVDRNRDGVANASDVVVYVTGSAVALDSVGTATGLVTLTSTPAALSVITVDYDWSNLDDDTLTSYVDEAHDYVVGKLAKVYNLPLASTPNIIKLIEKKLAAGYLLDKEYSVGGDEAEDTRGSRWIKWAERKLEDIADGLLELVDNSGNVFSQKSDIEIDGWPDETTEDDVEADSGGAIKFRIKKEF